MLSITELRAPHPCPPSLSFEPLGCHRGLARPWGHQIGTPHNLQASRTHCWVPNPFLEHPEGARSIPASPAAAGPCALHPVAAASPPAPKSGRV